MNEKEATKSTQPKEQQPPSYDQATNQNEPTTEQQTLLPHPTHYSTHPILTNQPHLVHQNHHSAQVHLVHSSPTYVLVNSETIQSSRLPMLMYCPYDNQQVITIVKNTTGCYALAMSGLLCCFCWPCFWVPFCTKSCLDYEHVCPICSNTLAKFAP